MAHTGHMARTGHRIPCFQDDEAARAPDQDEAEGDLTEYEREYLAHKEAMSRRGGRAQRAPPVQAVSVSVPAEEERQEEQEEAEYPMSEYEQHYQAHKESRALGSTQLKGRGFQSQRPMSPRSRRPRCVGSVVEGLAGCRR